MLDDCEVELFAGARSDGAAWPAHGSPFGITNAPRAERVGGQPLKSASTTQVTLPALTTCVSVVAPLIVPMSSSGKPSTETHTRYPTACATGCQENVTFEETVAFGAGCRSCGDADGQFAAALTSVVTEKVLFDGFESVVADAMLALFVMVPAVSGAFTVMLIEPGPAGSTGIVHCTGPLP